MRPWCTFLKWEPSGDGEGGNELLVHLLGGRILLYISWQLFTSMRQTLCIDLSRWKAPTELRSRRSCIYICIMLLLGMMRCEKKTRPQFRFLGPEIESAWDQHGWFHADSMAALKTQNCGRVFFSCPEQLNRTHCLSVRRAPLTIRAFTTLQSDPRDF